MSGTGGKRDGACALAMAWRIACSVLSELASLGDPAKAFSEVEKRNEEPSDVMAPTAIEAVNLAEDVPS